MAFTTSVALRDLPESQRTQAALVADVADASEALREEAMPQRVRRLLIAVVERAGELPGVRFSLAAQLLGITQPTIRSWVERGVLEGIPDVRPAAVTTRSLGEAIAAVATLRTAAGDERLLRRVLDELEDQRTRIDLAARIDEIETREVVDPERLATELFT